MRWWCAVSFTSLIPMFAMAGTRSASAADHACAELAIEADHGLRASWPQAIQELRGALLERDDIDACARVRLVRRHAAFDVEVVLPDGRSATRTVTAREDVLPTLHALLV